MGIELRGGAKIQGFWGLVGGGGGKMRELAQHARAYAQAHGIEVVFRGERTETLWRLSFHPAASDITVALEGGYVTLTARTGAVGPGYHAFVAGFVDYLSERGWVWDFDDAIHAFRDDSGYYADRDFAALQVNFADAFAAVSRQMIASPEDQGLFYVDIPLAVDIVADDFAATSLGFRDRTFFETPDASTFFPWWEEGVTGQTVRNMALSKMWLEVSWQTPLSAGETRDVDICAELIEHARAMGAEVHDDEGAADIDALRRGEAPGSTGVGYWRQDYRFQGPGGWTVCLPANYRQEVGEGSCSLTDGDRVVTLTGWPIDETPKLEWPTPPEDFDEDDRFNTVLYRAIVISGSEAREGGHVWGWQGIYQSLDATATVTVGSIHEDDRAWAEAVFRTVQPEAYIGRSVATVVM